MKISDFDYELPESRIARFPAGERDGSKLLVWHKGDISETRFRDISSVLPPGSLLVFNNTRVVRARLVMHRESGARIEVLCLEPTDPADYERAFAARGHCEWLCMVGRLKKWVGEIKCDAGEIELRARRLEPTREGAEQRVRFDWSADITFGELLERLGRVPIPPYLNREDEAIDGPRYQTVYARIEGSVAAPTAGLHFTPQLIERLGREGVMFESVTLHVGAGTFLPVKTSDALAHPMHTEHFEVTLAALDHLLKKIGHIVAVGTTSVRTLESLSALGWRIAQTGDPELEKSVGQFELYDIPETFTGAQAIETLAAWMRVRGEETLRASTRIMITPAGFTFRLVGGLVTNFHQPRSTLLLLIAAFVGENEWHRIYNHALAHDFRFLSYGDSSLLLR
ncbi:MAG: S-adenosylmethionine:tRNA ribosyltransferase-isomerase [Alistipes sp.]|nr:S-adenosylmethionine:tRNA ribosyltransferase-isomerase [Alistipes sp.]